ncbi:MAG: inorganic phosphate transporter [Candidatus Rokubacteria bacterium RBG_16_73_20]|nr:MAG: inorganic phosphate transporter [Candidatus Rokubacteria bacterium GWA2_73_35]OGK96874.1 MAG: inorganic phosphate transporter [Candidatus Rokubacteria bacterium RBG_16_73_20]
MSVLTAVVFIIFVALVFDFINGFHDAANSIATVVSTRVLTPLQAVVWAAFFNFVAAFGFGVSVARTVGKGVVEASVVDQWVILAGLLGAIVWDLITWYWGLPTSSSHALIGGFVGAALVKAGPGALVTSGLVKIGAFMILAPLIGLVVGFAMMVLTVRTFRRETPGRVDKVFRRGQLLSAAAYSLGHGTNDAQKTMGIIAILLFSTGHLGPEFYVPFWVVLAAHAAISLGTLSGGWRIVKTMGMRITKLRPIGGFCAETAGAVTLIGTALGGIPVSTTHTISGSIMGVGAIQRLSAVRWGVAGRIVWAWIMTVPASALVAAVAWLLIRVLVA